MTMLQQLFLLQSSTLDFIFIFILVHSLITSFGQKLPCLTINSWPSLTPWPVANSWMLHDAAVMGGDQSTQVSSTGAPML